MPQLKSPVFALDFQAQAAGSTKHSTMEIGRVNHAGHTGKLMRVAIDPKAGYWTVKNVTFSVKNKHLNATADAIFGKCRAAALSHIAKKGRV